jgi:UDP-N-acetylmuramate dehydrogenase
MEQVSWKQRLIRYAHAQEQPKEVFRTRWDFPKTVLGHRIILRKTMHSNMDWVNKLKGEVIRDEMLYLHTSLRVGGPADIFIYPKDIQDLKLIFQGAGTNPIFMLGEGSNLLVSDAGIRGIVVSLKNSFRSVQETVLSTDSKNSDLVLVKAEAGVKMSYLAKRTARLGLTGLEELAGIPGSIGGALHMNAGAEGSEISDIVKTVTVITPEGEIKTLSRDDIKFEYRSAIFPFAGGVIVGAEFELKKSDPKTIQNKISSYLDKRKNTQPLNLPNSGSVFKNPPGKKAGKLIQEAGLKGCSFGDAVISLKHANFIVNKGNAKASDVVKLIKLVQKEVKEHSGYELEKEIIFAGI